jgi:LmbE family N-acetylglucosaminyl deacetylase
LKNLKLKNENSEIYVPDGASAAVALARTTHLAIGAHPDDLEIMAYSAISECYESDESFFTGIVVTDGRGSIRNGRYADLSSAEFCRIRQQEQKKAADAGRYSAVVLLNYQSSEIKKYENQCLLNDLEKIIIMTRPEFLFLHNPFDQHISHIAVLDYSLYALKKVLSQYRPEMILGCEVWGSLDWLPEKYKTVLNCGRFPELAQKLLSIYRSQIECGKQYDKAVLARRRANATFYNAHKKDESDSLAFAADLSILLGSGDFSVRKYSSEVLNLFRDEVTARLRQFFSVKDDSD